MASDVPSVPPPPRAASVVDLQHTPVTLGVVLAVQAVALGAVLLVAGVVWGRIGSVESKVERTHEDVDRLRDDMRKGFLEMQTANADLRNEMRKGFATTAAELGELKVRLAGQR